MKEEIKIPKSYMFILNQLFELEQKASKLQVQNTIQRNLDKLKNYFETEALSDGYGLTYHNPIGESYNITRTDCEATISGEGYENLEIIEVLKPIIYMKYLNTQVIAQKGIVIVQSKKISYGKHD